MRSISSLRDMFKKEISQKGGSAADTNFYDMI